MDQNTTQGVVLCNEKANDSFSAWKRDTAREEEGGL